MGLDGEWKPGSRTPVSILQVATRTDAFVVDMFAVASATRGDDAREAFDAFLHELLRSAEVYKLGFSFGYDLTRMKASYPHLAVAARERRAEGDGGRQAARARREREPLEPARRPRDADQDDPRRDAQQGAAVQRLVAKAAGAGAARLRRRRRVLPEPHLRQVPGEVAREAARQPWTTSSLWATRAPRGSTCREKPRRRSRSRRRWRSA